MAPAPLARPPVARESPSNVFRHHDPELPVFHGTTLIGSRGLPSVFVEAMSSDKLNFLRESSGASSWDGSPRGWGFEADSKEHGVFKADWHAMPALGAKAEVFVPRLSQKALVQQAPPRIVAFLESFREVNSACWARISDALDGLRHGWGWEEQERNWLIGLVQGALKRQGTFGVIEAQVWDGGRISLRSHQDGVTSLLHLGVTLGGERLLRIGRFPDGRLKAGGSKVSKRKRDRMLGIGGNVWDREKEDPENLWDIEMVPGSVYLSSPFCYEHAVMYHSSTRSEPVIALQCRLAFFEESDARHANSLRNGHMEDISRAICETLATATDRKELRLPSEHEVAMMEARLASERSISSQDAFCLFWPSRRTNGKLQASSGYLAVLVVAFSSAMRGGLRQRRPRK